LKARLVQRTTHKLERLGKYLIVEFDDQSRLLLHLGMTGQLFVSGASSMRLLSAERRQSLTPEAQIRFAADPHTHLALYFVDRGPSVLFRDVRKFGKCAWLRPGHVPRRLQRLGVDALQITGSALHSRCRPRKIPIKTLLLDQSVLAGVGNIYADEALFAAKIRPSRRASSLTLAECTALAGSVRDVLERSIALGGSSIDDYIRPDGTDGGYQLERKVYARTGQPCPMCSTAVRRVVLGQRSSHYCASCQR
jgi:formamidopyrimidine-DNA glycosylase